MVKNLPAMWEAQDRFLGQEDLPWRREWLPTPVFLLRESHGQRSLAGYSPLGCKESDMTEQLTLSLSGEELKKIEEKDSPLPLNESERGE